MQVLITDLKSSDSRSRHGADTQMQPITMASHAIWPSRLCTMQVAARATSADSLAESEVSATLPDSADEESDDSDASDGKDTEWEPQQGAPPPVADGVTKLAEGTLDADVKEVYSRLLADQVSFC